MIREFVAFHQLPTYRIQQFNQAYYRDLITSFDAFSTWPKALREQLKEEVPFSTLRQIKTITSKHGDTEKILFERISDGKRIETVLMKHRDGRNTVCVSCMVGCPVGCTFCATGHMGFLANLTGREIIDQVLYVARILKGEKRSVTNVVFMGMGEPLLNLESVHEAIAVLTDTEKLAMSIRRITVSTSGHTDNLKKLLNDGYMGRLALSLHAPNQKLREKLMPIAKKYPLPELLDVLEEYAKKTNKRVSFEYTLIDGINDTENLAEELAGLLGHRLTHINLIPFNPVPLVPCKRSSPEVIRRFSQILTNHHIPHTLRVPMGDDIGAACGQLAGKV